MNSEEIRASNNYGEVNENTEYDIDLAHNFVRLQNNEDERKRIEEEERKK